MADSMLHVSTHVQMVRHFGKGEGKGEGGGGQGGGEGWRVKLACCNARLPAMVECRHWYVARIYGRTLMPKMALARVVVSYSADQIG